MVVGTLRGPMQVTGWSAASPLGFGRESLREAVARARECAPAATAAGTAAGTAAATTAGTFAGRFRGKPRPRAQYPADAYPIDGCPADAYPTDAYPADGYPLDGGRANGSMVVADLVTEKDRSAATGLVLGAADARLAIRHGLMGPSTAVPGGRASALIGLEYARSLLTDGRADAMICASSAQDGGGAAALRVVVGLDVANAARQPVLASVLAVDSEFCAPGSPGGPAEAVRTVVERVLDRAWIEPDEVWAAVPSGLEPAERSALVGIFGAAAVDRLPSPGDLLGETGPATAAFGLAIVLAQASDRNRICVLTCVDPEGPIGAAVLLVRPTLGICASGAARSPGTV